MSLTRNINVIDKWLEGRKRAISDEEIGGILRGAAINAYQKALKETPQWSGYMASNLTISIDGDETPASSSLKAEYKGRSQSPVYSKGDAVAVGIANTRNRWVNDFKGITMRSKVSIHYANPQPYYSAVENYPEEFLRDVNLPGRALYRAGKMLPSYAYYKEWRIFAANQRIE